jgi:hypothetical protein
MCRIYKTLLKHSGYYTCTSCFNVTNLCTFPTDYIYVFHMILRIKRNYLPNHHNQIDLSIYDGDAVFLVRQELNF